MSIELTTERILAEELLDILTSEAEPEAALLAALRALLTASGRTAGVLFIFSGDEAQPVWRVEAGLSAAWTQQLEDDLSPLRQCAEAWRRYSPATPGPCLTGLAAAVPLVAHARTVGTLLIEGPALDPVTAERLEYLGRCVAGAVLRNWEAWHNPLPKQEAAALEKIAAALSSSLELDEILTSAVQSIGEMLDAQAVSLLLHDDQAGCLLFKKLLNGGPDWMIQQIPGTVAAGLLGACQATGQMISVKDAEADPRFVPALDGLAGVSVRSLLLAPLLARGQSTGVIALINRRHGRFSTRDRGLLGTLAASLANTIYNARLYHNSVVANSALDANRAEIIRSRNTLRSLIDGISSPIYIVDHDCRIVALNRACAALTGRQPQAIVGLPCLASLGRGADACDDCPVHQTFDTGVGAQRSVHRRGQAGAGQSDWLVSTYPIQEGAGTASQVIVFEQDVTEQRQMEAMLAQADKLAAMGKLTAGIVHEIGNPLTAVKLNAQLLQRGLPIGSDQRESAELIAVAVERAIHTVRELLDFSRQEDQAFGLVDVNATLRQAAALTEHQLRGDEIQLIYHLAEALPPVAGSRDHLQGVWLNMILNARDAIHNSHREIRLSTRLVENKVEVLIADTGDGIPPEHLPRVFEPFFTTKTAGQGTGLGLSVCHRIVQQHGGEILVDSARGHGTTFTVRLPKAA